MSRIVAFRRLIVAALVFSFVIFSLSQSHAMQSGRKPAKRPESPDPLPPKQEEPPVKAPEQDSKQIPVTVVWYLQYANSSSILARVVQSGCLDRLAKTRSVSATAGRDVNRKGASDMAKGSTTYVLWFELEPDIVDTENARSSVGQVNAQYLYVNYEVFTPGTGKRKASGHVYQRPRGPLNMPMPVPQTNSPAELTLRYAGMEMADRLLDVLSLPHPDRN